MGIHASVALHSRLVLPLAVACRLLVPADSVIDRLIRERVETGRNAGVVVGIIDSSGARRYFGYGSAGPGRPPIGPSTVFEIGSVTKVFTTALLAEMARRREVSLGDSVQEFLPPTMKVATVERAITLLDLATQSSGLPRLPSNLRPADPADPYADYGNAQLVQFLESWTPQRAPGVQYEYSNLGVGLLGYLLGVRDGGGYEQALGTRVLGPLGLTDTRITRSTDMERRLAVGHDRDGDSVESWHMNSLAAAGALSSTLDDMLNFLAANMDSASSPLGAALAMTHPAQRPTTIPNTSIGLAWHIRQLPGTDIVWHNGETGGYHSFIGFDPVRHVGVVILTNSATSIDDLGFHLLDERNTLDPPPAPPREPVITASLLQRYAGVYEIAPGARLTVTRDGSRLYARISGQQRFRVFATSDSTFRYTVVEAQLTFQRDTSGVVTGAVLHQGGRDLPMRRVP